MRWTDLTLSLALSALLALPLAAEPLRAPDVLRLRDIDSHLGAALREALAQGDAEALVAMTEAMRGLALPNTALDPSGDWNCRTIKLGGLVPAVAYGNFRCRIEATSDQTWTLTKLTGSQRVTGTLTITAEGPVHFTGVGYVGEAPALPYGDLPATDQTPVEPNQTTAEVGIFEQMDPDRARLLLPAPLLESRFDILYLTR
ncbi:DUF4893 domain-containing protein [Jannaschia pohangensis]|uniref:DUF4893 domain-containing protein n=1 Tax=Jannaschia pohangensis TaxID=390807 RepID=A0A1I3JP37_9RHOB|nr:DUF4893 domain-containing protein [Jannaschia pohangensis]SFI61924.1 protein of unknown function [Jannaschia pohangensis]